MCNPFKEVTAYQDCNGEVHATKLDATAASIANSISTKNYSSTRMTRYDVKEVLSLIIKSDEARSYFKDLIEDKERERYAELTKAFCTSSKTC